MDEPRKMGPLAADHPAVTGTADFPPKLCPGCDKRFEAGDYVTLIQVGPGEDEEARERAREGRPYNAVAVIAHWACATGEE